MRDGYMGYDDPGLVFLLVFIGVISLAVLCWCQIAGRMIP